MFEDLDFRDSVVNENPGILEDVKLSVLIANKEDMGPTTEENQGGVNVLHDDKLPFLNPDLDDIAGEDIDCHRGVNAE